MAENSAIEWTHHTFNPWVGCTKVGPGCDNCYASDLATVRLGVKWGPGAERRHTAASTWRQPRSWNRKAEAAGVRYRVFCASLADVFDNEVPAEWRAELFQLIRETPHLDWLLVTKRIGNAARMAQAAGGFPGNVWLGATVVNQAEADRDVVKLLTTEGPRFHFLSIEPLLGPLELYPPADDTYQMLSEWYGPDGFDETGSQPRVTRRRDLFPKIDWVIVGGESGPRARPMHPDWARSLRDQCAAAGVPFLFKQWGEFVPIFDREVEDPDWRNCGRWEHAHPKGCWWNLAGGTGFHGERVVYVDRVGKKRAGRLLDGVQHDGYPAAHSAASHERAHG